MLGYTTKGLVSWLARPCGYPVQNLSITGGVHDGEVVEIVASTAQCGQC